MQPKIDDVVGEHGETRAELIIQAIRAGSYAVVAARFAGIDETTYYRWLRGKGARYRQFRQSIADARAAAEVRMTGLVMTAAAGGTITEVREERNEKGEVTGKTTTTRTVGPDGRLALEYLSRVHPDRYGRRQAIEVGPLGSTGEGQPGLDDAEARRLAAGFERWRLARADGEQESIEAPPPAAEDDDVTDAEIVDDEQEED